MAPRTYDIGCGIKDLKLIWHLKIQDLGTSTQELGPETQNNAFSLFFSENLFQLWTYSIRPLSVSDQFIFTCVWDRLSGGHSVTRCQVSHGNWTQNCHQDKGPTKASGDTARCKTSSLATQCRPVGGCSAGSSNQLSPRVSLTDCQGWSGTGEVRPPHPAHAPWLSVSFSGFLGTFCPFSHSFSSQSPKEAYDNKMRKKIIQKLQNKT